MTIDRHDIIATAGTNTLQVLRGTITVDDTRAPFVEATLTIATPVDPSVIDPRTPARVHLAMLQGFGELAFTRDITALWDAEEIALTSDLTALWDAQGVTLTSDLFSDAAWYDEPRTGTSRELDLVVRATRELRDGTTELELASDESLLLDLPYFEYVKGYYDELTVRDSLAAVLAKLEDNGLVWPTEIIDGPADALMNLEEEPVDSGQFYLIIRPGDSIWDAYQTSMQDGNRIFRDLGTGGIQILQANYTTTDTLTLTDGAGGTIVEFEIEITRDSRVWGDAVLLYWEDGGQDFYLGSASSNTGWNRPLSLRMPGVSPNNQFGFPEPGPGSWSTRADVVLERASVRGRQVEIVAVNDYSAFPRAALSLTVDEAEFTGRVQAVQWDIGDTWEMRITASNLEEIV